MTSLRFVGDMPLWLGSILAVIVAILSWAYYNRESFELPRRLRILLPLLRSTAFVLGILILTGPVLHHKKTIGELGKIKVFVDLSQSMEQLDKHMGLARKLKIAEQHGWLVDSLPEFPLLDAIDSLSAKRIDLMRDLDRLTQSDQAETEADKVFENLKQPITEFSEQVKALPEVPAESKTVLLQQVTQPLESLIASPVSFSESRLRNVLAVCEREETKLINKVNNELKQELGSKSDALATAVDLFDESPRWRRIAMALGGDDSQKGKLNLLKKLADHHDVELFFLNQEKSGSSRIEVDQPIPFSELAEKNQFVKSTDLSSRIATSLNPSGETNSSEQESETKAAIVLLTDGQHNLGPSPVQTARNLAAQGYHFYNVAFGARNPAVDLAVLKLEYPKLVFKKDEIRGVMTIRDSMTPGTAFVAQILSGDKVLWQEQLVARNIQERRIEFQFRIDELLEELLASPDEIETYIRQLPLTATISPLPEETESANNSQAMRLSVITESYKVLIMDGRSRWETRFIRNAFERDEQWEVNTIIAGKSTSFPTLPRGDQSGEFPLTRNELFEYDLLIWGEVDTELLDPKELQWVADFVETRGGGIVFIDGLRGKLRLLEPTAMANLVPVLSTKDPLTTVPDSLELAPPGVTQPAFALATDKQENEEFWKELPPPKTIVPIEPAADATILVNALVGEEKYPAVLTRNYGAGRVVYLAFDESWRWRYKTADKWHQRAWQQIAKFAMPQPFAVSDEYVSIDTGPASYESGENPAVRVKLNGIDGKPNPDSIVEALVWKDGKVVSTVSLAADPNIPGLYRNELDGLDSGEYEISVRASGYQDSALKSRSRFLILPPESGEMSETSVNVELLRQMATESGGKYIPEEDLSNLPDLLQPFSNGRVVESDTQLWQSYWWFAAMMLLLTIEWILRKRAGLL